MADPVYTLKFKGFSLEPRPTKNDVVSGEVDCALVQIANDTPPYRIIWRVAAVHLTPADEAILGEGWRTNAESWGKFTQWLQRNHGAVISETLFKLARPHDPPKPSLRESRMKAFKTLREESENPPMTDPNPKPQEAETASTNGSGKAPPEEVTFSGMRAVSQRVQAIRAKNALNRMRQVMPVDLMGIVPNDPSPTPPKSILVTPTQDLWIDAAYQRDISRASMRLILRMVEKWSWEKFKPPIVAPDAEGRLCVIDGQHTAIGAASHPKINKIPALLLDAKTVADAAEAFISHNTDRVLVTPIDRFNAKIAAENPTALDISEMMDRLGLKLVRHMNIAQTSEDELVNRTVAIGELTTLYSKLGPARFLQMLEVIKQCNFAPIRREHFAAVARILFGSEHAGARGINTELLVEVIRSISQEDAWHKAAQLASASRTSKGAAMATIYRNRYDALRRGN